MSNVIRSWLLMQLGVLLEDGGWNIETTGILIAKLLHRYNLITRDQLMSIDTGDENREQTYRYIKEAINRLSIELSAEDFEDILTGNSTKAAILFYELYLALHDKNITHFIGDIKLRKDLNEVPEKFKVENIPSKCSESVKFDNPLAHSLEDHFDIIEWHKCKVKTIVEKCRASRMAYLNFLAQNESINKCKPNDLENVVEKNAPSIAKQLCNDDKTLNLSYDELLKEERDAQELCPYEPDYQKAQGFLKSVHTKRKSYNARKENQEMMQRMLLKELWDKILYEQKEYFEGEFRELLLKQTVYEQQMATTLMEIREESNKMKENKRRLMECIRLKHEQRFIDDLMNSKQKEQEEKNGYYAEKERNLELHERLYAHKLKRKAMKHYDTCLEALNSIVDMAVFKSDYEKYNCQHIPKSKWYSLVSLFIKGKPIYNELEPIELLNYQPDELPEDLEIIYIPEIEKDNCIDDMLFEAYCENFWYWNIDEDFPSFDYKTINLANNILGYIVHRLLLAKYPKAKMPPPPEIPRPSVAVCANGLTDLKYIPALQKLLQASNIKVIQMQDAINYCLSAWKEESTIEYMDTALTEVKGAEKKKAKPKAKGKKGKKGGSKKSAERAAVSVQFEEKNVQTPKLFPDEELCLSNAGKLGMLAFEILNMGDTPNDNLMVAMFIEYLKSLQGIEGWVLVNYPKTIEQVAVLEEALNSVPFPPYNQDTDTLEDVVTIISRDILQNEQDEDLYAEKRLSKLVPNPKPIDEPIYNTYLTAYIELRSAEGDDIEEQYYDCFRSIENDNLMNRFYMEQGCKYTLIYKDMDFPAVKHLGKLILGDYSLPRKTSVEMFTDTVNYVEAEFEKLIDESVAEKIVSGEQKSKKSKKSKGEGVPKKKSSKDLAKAPKSKSKKSEKESKSSKKSKESKSKEGKSKKKRKSSVARPVEEIVHEDKETQAPEEEIEPAIPIQEPSQQDIPEQLLPGEDDWYYINIQFLSELEKILATIWENVESIYIGDMKVLFFRERIAWDQFAPFRKHLLEHYRDFLVRPTDKNKYLHDFQVWYNQIDEDMRADEEVKAELHMRVHEFREQLYRCCDEFQQENEAERKRLIEADCLTNILFEIANIYSLIMQLEIDRCADSMQLLNDYYTCMVTKSATRERPLGKIKLQLIPMPMELDEREPYEQYIAFIGSCFQGQDEFPSESPFTSFLEKNEKTALAKINEYKKASQAVYDKLSSSFTPGKGKKASFEPEPEVKDKGAELLQEFQMAYVGEAKRAEFRVQLSSFKGQRWLWQMVFIGLDTFVMMITENEKNYNNHIASVDKACGYFQRAIEEETKIQPEMVFIDDAFYIKLNSVLYESELPDVVEQEPDPITYDTFTIEQLQKVTDILSDLAPNGLIPERTFTFLLQDFLVCDKLEDGKQSLVPQLWRQLHPHATHELMQAIFGDSEYIDWKDFIIYNLGIEFPTEVELLKTRESFRKLDTDITELIYEHQFGEVDFWFNSDDENETSRLKPAKDLLIRLFKIDQERVNYTALLLAFCKDENPIAGLAKAIDLSLGTVICWRQDHGEMYYNWLKKQYLEMKTEQKDGELLVDDVISDIIDTSVHRCTSTYLEDYVDEAEAEENEDYAKQVFDDGDILTYLHETTKNINEGEEMSSGSTFTNLSQGYECTYKDMQYFLDFDALINVLTVCLPWEARKNNVNNYSLRHKITLIYQSKIINEYDRVFAYQLFNEPKFIELISSFYKFFVRNPSDVVKKLVNQI